MDRVRIGVVGVGPNAQVSHLPVLNSFKDVDIVALCDIDEDMLQNAGRQWNVKDLFTSHHDMIERTALDGISVVTAVSAVGLVAGDCLKNGIKTLIEKPPGITLKDTKMLLEAANEGRTWGMVAFNRRFVPLVTESKSLIEAEGPIISIITEFHPFNFEHYREAGISEEALRHFHAAQSIHAVDLMHFLGGPVKEVTGEMYSPLSPYGDSFNAMLRFESGAVGHIICNYSSSTRMERAQIFGNGITVVLEGSHPTGPIPYTFEMAKLYKGNLRNIITSETKDSCWNAGFVQENRFFIDCIKHERPPRLPAADLEEAVRTMEIIESVVNH